MEKNEVTQFKGLLKVLDIVYLIMTVSLGFVTLILLALTTFVTFQSKEDLKKILTAENAKTSIELSGVKYQFKPEYLEKYSEVDKEMLVALIIVAILSVIIAMIIVWFARKLIRNFKINQIFTKNNGNYIEAIAIMILVVGHISKVLSSMVGIFINKSFHFGEYLINNGAISSVGYKMFSIDWTLILISLTIWFIGRAFKYGAFLQEEYNETV
ncbi:DUF2975 domain-containing protein [Macrococcus equi]|uniref:DUF2975 domain-containing protein n=1 Tax=Macrococcus equi TaxID=3395462 RepID=UPI0039BDF154